MYVQNDFIGLLSGFLNLLWQFYDDSIFFKNFISLSIYGNSFNFHDKSVGLCTILSIFMATDVDLFLWQFQFSKRMTSMWESTNSASQ